MIRKPFASILLAASMLASTSAIAGGAGGASGGALEVTQLANNAELVAQVGESSQQTATQLSQLEVMLQQIAPLVGKLAYQELMDKIENPALRAALSRINDANQFTELYAKVHQQQELAANLSGTAWSAYSLMRPMLESITQQLKSGAKLSSMDVHDLFRRAWESIPQKEKDLITPKGMIMTHEQYAKVLAQRLTDVGKATQDLLTQSKSIPEITGTVKGLQFIASQNVALQAAIHDMTSTLIRLAMDNVQRQTEAVVAENLRKLQDQAIGSYYKSQAAFGLTTPVEFDWKKIFPNQPKR